MMKISMMPYTEHKRSGISFKYVVICVVPALLFVISISRIYETLQLTGITIRQLNVCRTYINTDCIFLIIRMLSPSYWSQNDDGTYTLQIDMPYAHNNEYEELRIAEFDICDICTRIQMYKTKIRNVYYIDDTRQSALAVIERMLIRRKIIIKSIPLLVYKQFTISNYDPLKDEDLIRQHLPEVYLQINDLQAKHLIKQGSYYFIQNAWMQRLLSSLDIEHDLLSQRLLFDSDSWLSGHDGKTIKFNPFSLNIHHNRISNGKRGKYAHSREEWIISISRFEEFKQFMSRRTTSICEAPTIRDECASSTHQACYLIQLFADKDTSKYKIGKSKNIMSRLKSPEYRNAFIYLVCYVDDETICEKELIDEFSTKYQQIKNDSEGGFGNEIFSGNIYEMMDLFYSICSHHRST